MKTKKLVHLAMLSALTILLGVIPNIGIIQTGVVSLTILHIPVIIAAFLYGVSGGSIIGIVFGVTSWYVASTRGVSPLDLLFVNPLVSVLPRILFGIVAGWLSRLLMDKNSNWIKEAIVAGVSSVLHSFFVLTMLFIVGLNLFYAGSDIIEAFRVYIAFILAVNVIPEALFAAFICVSINKVLKKK